MHQYYWNDWYSGWGWFLWYGVFLLILFSFGNWGYTYRAHRRFDGLGTDKKAIDILNQRYANGEFARDEYLRMKSEILSETTDSPNSITQANDLKNQRKSSSQY
jgi:putative membrane protein